MTAVPWRRPRLRLPPRTVVITPAQARVLTGLFCGMRPAQMADDQRLSVWTVKSQVHGLYLALGVHTAAQAVAIVASGRVRVLVQQSRWAA